MPSPASSPEHDQPTPFEVEIAEQLIKDAAASAVRSEREAWIEYAKLLRDEISKHIGLAVAHGYTGDMEGYRRGAALRAELEIGDEYEDLRRGAERG